VDLALIATPAAKVAEILDQCGEFGVRVAVVYSAGFAEQGERGTALQDRWWRPPGATASGCWGRTASG
jgi:acetyltransferase